MKVLIAYFSQTGNTEKVGQAIYEEVSKNHTAEMKSVHKISVDSLNAYQLVFVGAPCHDTDLAKPVKHFLDSLPKKPPYRLAGFFTHATYSPGDAKRSNELFQEWAGKCGPSFESTCQRKQIEFLGYFHCQGAPSPPIEEFIRREIITSDEEWNKYLPEVRKHPTSEDLTNANSFARTLLKQF
jgi:flavodoxin